MTKMNWDRVRDWDRVRGDLSDMELADERDERWLQRERDRDERKATPVVSSRSAPRVPKPLGVAKQKLPRPGPATGVPTSRTSHLATALGVSTKVLHEARQAETQTSAALTGMKSKKRLAMAARQLGITPQ